MKKRKEFGLTVAFLSIVTYKAGSLGPHQEMVPATFPPSP